MSVSRRRVVIQGAQFATTITLAGLFECVGAEAQTTLPERRNLADLALNDPVLEALREAVRRLKGMSPSERTSWVNLAAIHGTDRGFNRCPHGNWYFLPWHRAYLLMYERMIRELTGFPRFALPYWDWARSRQLPEAFAQARWAGSENPLYEASRAFGPTESLSDEIVGPRVMLNIFGASAFEQFGTTRPQGQNSLDPTWVQRRTGRQGTLEGNPHNNIHGILGGLMGTARSALDPVFLMHHCNIDRIWAVWRTGGHDDSPERMWLDMPFENHFMNPDSTPYSPRVKELLDPVSLGYTYGLTTPVAASSPAVNAQAALVAQVLSDAVSEGVGIRRFSARVSGRATVGVPLQIPITLDAALVAQVARRPSPPSGDVVADFKTLQELAARGTRAIAVLRNIEVTDGDRSLYRVFVDCDYLSIVTPITDRHYVGTFGFFGDHTKHGHGQHGGDRPSISLDLTNTLKQIYGTVPVVPGSLRVQILPVSRGRGPQESAGTATPEEVEIAFVST